MTLQKNTKIELKEKLAKAVEGMSKDKALEFLDKYKDSVKHRDTLLKRLWRR